MYDIIHWIAIFGGFMFGISTIVGLLILVIILVLGGRADRRMQKFQEALANYERQFE